MPISKKVMLIGHFNVGKTSLIRKFVKNSFSEDYITSIGVTIEKKEVVIDNQQLTMIIWDVAGETSFEKTQSAYFKGIHGMIYVFDITRESTWSNLEEQINGIRDIYPFIPIKIIANKIDLLNQKELKSTIESFPFKCDFFSSAKTGENVEEMFLCLGKDLMK